MPRAELPGLRPPVPSSSSALLSQESPMQPNQTVPQARADLSSHRHTAPWTAGCGHRTSGPARWPTHLAHGLRDPKSAAAADETHGGLQAHLVAH